MPQADLKYKIALGLIPGIGDINARKLVSFTGSVEAVFSEPYSSLIKIPGIGEVLARAVVDRGYLETAEKEAEWITGNKISTFFYLDENYPARLRECEDSPVMMYYRGTADLSAPKMLSIVGTRKATSRGREICEAIIGKLAQIEPELIIVSGLAYGIDIAAHKAAMNSGLPTIAVLAHGLKTIYPPMHANIVREMISNGGILSDFISDAPAERNNFLKRNRIIAGLPQALLIVESGVKGGAMVTAEMAMSYSRDVMAIPGRPTDNWSGGCNRLIKRNIAALVENAADICEFLNWEQPTTSKPIQTKLFTDMDDTEKRIFDELVSSEALTVDQLSSRTGIGFGKLSGFLLSLEMKGAIRCCPGNIYKITSPG
jgi:DNA processing protein